MKKKKKPKDEEKRGKNEGFLKHKFKKGQPSANPIGARAHNPETRKLKNLSKKELVELGNLVVQGNVGELRRIHKDKKNSSSLKAMVAAMVIRVIDKGDNGAFESLLNRLIGKVPDKLDVDGNLNVNTPRVVVTLPSNGREAKTIEKAKAREEDKDFGHDED